MSSAPSGVTQSRTKEKSAYRAVRELLDNMNGTGQYDLTEVNAVGNEIQELAQRIEKIHVLSKEFRAVTLSPYVKSMLRLVGKDRLVENFDL